MTNDLAKQILVALVNDSILFRGVLLAREAWGYSGIPSENEQKELKNLINFLEEMALALEEDRRI